MTEPRAVCGRCRRPVSVCYCAHLPALETRTRVVILQHPRERDVPIGTARMASLCLPGAELLVGTDFDAAPQLARLLADPTRPAALLYPGPGARDVVRDPPDAPITLVVVDGTWSLARKLVRTNRTLAALPRVAFVPDAPSDYRIRREPDPSYVSTIEALALVLGALEGDPARFRAMLQPFRAMVDAQLEARAVRGTARVRYARAASRPRAPRAARLPRALVHAGDDDVVCVAAEANSWPYRRDGVEAGRRHDELVHWVARRLGTGEVLDVVVAPRGPIAPSTAAHVRLEPSAITAGVPLAELHARFGAFVRPRDVVCAWGAYGVGLYLAEGGALPEARVDVRLASRELLKRRAGTLEQVLEALGAEPPSVEGAGRARLRVRQLERAVRALRAIARDELGASPARV